MKKLGIIISPDGHSQIIFNLQKFCKENNLIPSSMCNVAAGRYKQNKGWKCEKYEKF